MIGKAMHPTHLGAPYVLRQRDELLSILLEYVAPTVNPKSSPRKDDLIVPHSVRIAGLNAIATYTYAWPSYLTASADDFNSRAGPWSRFLEPSIPDKLQSDLAHRTCTFLELGYQPKALPSTSLFHSSRSSPIACRKQGKRQRQRTMQAQKK